MLTIIVYFLFGRDYLSKFELEFGAAKSLIRTMHKLPMGQQMNLFSLFVV